MFFWLHPWSPRVIFELTPGVRNPAKACFRWLLIFSFGCQALIRPVSGVDGLDMTRFGTLKLTNFHGDFRIEKSKHTFLQHKKHRFFFFSASFLRLNKHVESYNSDLDTTLSTLLHYTVWFGTEIILVNTRFKDIPENPGLSIWFCFLMES